MQSLIPVVTTQDEGTSRYETLFKKQKLLKAIMPKWTQLGLDDSY